MELVDFECGDNGLHIAETASLRIFSARENDIVRYTAMCSEPSAQHWLGWDDVDILDEDHRRIAFTLPDGGSIRTPHASGIFFAGVDKATGAVLGGVDLTRQRAGWYDIGGAVHAEHRGRGVGTELLRAACEIVRGHFGVRRLTAACETTNVASRKWLLTAGFTATTGPLTHQLPNGQRIAALHFERVHADSELACEHLKPSIARRVRRLARRNPS